MDGAPCPHTRNHVNLREELESHKLFLAEFVKRNNSNDPYVGHPCQDVYERATNAMLKKLLPIETT